jgi:lysyl-tRNA synthetase class II
LSEWKKQRQNDIRRAKEDEEPYFAAAYPRLTIGESSPARKSVSEFLESFERLTDDEPKGKQQKGLSRSEGQRENDARRPQEDEEPFTDPDPRLTNGESFSERRSVPEFSKSFDGFADDEVVLMGRVRSKRTAGQKLIFLDIVNEFQKAQVMLEKSQMTTGHYCRAHRFKLMKQLIQVGDHICTSGLKPTKLSDERPLTIP